MNRRTIRSSERPRCQAMTQATTYDASHPCWYQVEAGHETDVPLLCAKHMALAERKAVQLVDGRFYRSGAGFSS